MLARDRMVVASQPRTTTLAHTSVTRSSEQLLLETVVGRLLEWVVNSVEGVRERLHRGTR